MDKRAGLRQFYQSQEAQAKSDKQFQDRSRQLASLEDTLVQGLNALIAFLDGKTTKTEVVNQLKSISTPDVDKVVKAVEQLDASVTQNKLDLKPLESLLSGIRREVSLIPKSHAEMPEMREDVRVTNLSDVKLDVSEVTKAIKALKLDPKIDVKSPDVQVNTDLKPVQDILLDVLKAINKIQLDVPEFPDIPATDLSKVETKLDESNKHLKKLVDKPIGGGGGGGGNATPYQADGKASYVDLVNGQIPTADATAQAIGQAVYDALTRLQPLQNAIPYARDESDQMRVTVASGRSMVMYQYWAAAGTAASYYGTGAPNSMDAREQTEYQSIENFNMVRQGRWTF